MEVWDDPELMQLTEESCVRDLASGYWARARISDAYWFSRADIWYQHSVPGQPAVVPAIHPCSYTRRRSSSNASSGSTLSTPTNEIEEVEEEPAQMVYPYSRNSTILHALRTSLRRPPPANSCSAASSAQECRSSIGYGMSCFRRALRRPCCKSCADEHGEGPSHRQRGRSMVRRC